MIVIIILFCFYFNSCNSKIISTYYLFNIKEIENRIDINIIGNEFFIKNFSNKPNIIQVKCENIFNKKPVKGLPLKV